MTGHIKIYIYNKKTGNIIQQIFCTKNDAKKYEKMGKGVFYGECDILQHKIINGIAVPK